VVVRPARIGDLDDLVRFIREEAREAESVEKMPATLRRGIEAALTDDSKSSYWVMADAQDALVGCVSALKEWSDWNAGYYWWIQSLYLVPACRGQGHIQLLVDAVSAEMTRQGGLELRLYVHAGNGIAIRAYEKIGFEMSAYKIMVRRQGQSA
jgi:ribosomal protein S18 acetylase RimI-like enzyme